MENIEKNVARTLKLREALTPVKLTEKQKIGIVEHISERIEKRFGKNDSIDQNPLHLVFIEELMREIEKNFGVDCYTDIPKNNYFQVLALIESFLIDERAMEQEMGRLIKRLSHLAHNLLVCHKDTGTEDDYIYVTNLTTNLSLWYDDVLHEIHAVA